MPEEGHEDSFATSALRNRRDRPWPLIGLGLVARRSGVAALAGDALAPRRRGGSCSSSPVPRSSGSRASGNAGTGRRGRRLQVRTRVCMRRVFKRIAITLGTLVALVLVSAAIVAAAYNVHLGNGIGDRSYTVAGTRDLAQLLQARDRRTDPRPGATSGFTRAETHVKARVDIGNLPSSSRRTSPCRCAGMPSSARFTSSAGRTTGTTPRRRSSGPGKRRLVWSTHLGAGVVRVTRAVRVITDAAAFLHHEMLKAVPSRGSARESRRRWAWT